MMVIIPKHVAATVILMKILIFLNDNSLVHQLVIKTFIQIVKLKIPQLLTLFFSVTISL